MRGADEQTGALFSHLSPDAMVPKDRPLRVIRPLVNAALARLSPDFERLYAPTGRASIAPEKLLRALLLQAFYSVRSERHPVASPTMINISRDIAGSPGRCWYARRRSRPTVVPCRRDSGRDSGRVREGSRPSTAAGRAA